MKVRPLTIIFLCPEGDFGNVVAKTEKPKTDTRGKKLRGFSLRKDCLVTFIQMQEINFGNQIPR
jgi:hypothetical protein